MVKPPRSKSLSISQHWVPQVYLRAFATPQTRGSANPQIWAFSKRDGNGPPFLTSIRKVCAKRYLYSPETTDGSRWPTLEQRLGNVESLLSRVWPSLAGGTVDLGDPHIRQAVALFTATMHLRNPRLHSAVQRLHAHIVSQVHDAIAKHGVPAKGDVMDVLGHKLTWDADDWENYRNAPDSEHHWFFVENILRESGTCAQILLKKRWSFLVSEKPNILTSDTPVQLTRGTRPCGFATPGAVVTIPVGPQRLLVMDDLHSKPSNQYYPLPERSVGALTYSQMRSASHFLLSATDIDAALAEMIRWRQRSSP